jgi:competence protein CoiA
VTCAYGAGETEAHRLCKKAIYQALLKAPGVTHVALERSFKTARPDIFAYFDGVPVAIEIQISTLTLETIIRRTKEYARQGIFVLWLLPWSAALEEQRYSPKLWEKWISAAYYGNVYYWLEDLTVAGYGFEPFLQYIEKRSWYSKRGKLETGGGFTAHSKRFRSPVRKKVLNLVRDFGPCVRGPWGGKSFVIPESRLFMERSENAARN